jgi:hypothetical protein
MGSKTALDIEGFEYDWLGTDGDDHVALFSTAGAGYAPPGFLRDTDAHHAAIKAILALPTTTTPRIAPTYGPNVVNTWRLVAERGLYAYDCSPNGGPYRLLAAPVAPVRSSALPASIAEVVNSVTYPAIRFATLDTITDELLK